MKAIKKNYLTKKKKAMQIKTIEKVIINKMNEWLETITDEDLRKETKNNLLVSGGSIANLAGQNHLSVTAYFHLDKLFNKKKRWAEY